MTVRFKKRKAAIHLGELSGRLSRQGGTTTAVCSVRPLSLATDEIVGKGYIGDASMSEVAEDTSAADINSSSEDSRSAGTGPTSGSNGESSSGLGTGCTSIADEASSSGVPSLSSLEVKRGTGGGRAAGSRGSSSSSGSATGSGVSRAGGNDARCDGRGSGNASTGSGNGSSGNGATAEGSTGSGSHSGGSEEGGAYNSNSDYAASSGGQEGDDETHTDSDGGGGRACKRRRTSGATAAGTGASPELPPCRPRASARDASLADRRVGGVTDGRNRQGHGAAPALAATTGGRRAGPEGPDSLISIEMVAAKEEVEAAIEIRKWETAAPFGRAEKSGVALSSPRMAAEGRTMSHEERWFETTPSLCPPPSRKK